MIRVKMFYHNSSHQTFAEFETTINSWLIYHSDINVITTNSTDNSYTILYTTKIVQDDQIDEVD